MVLGIVVTRDLRESRARNTPSRPSGAMLAIHADWRGDQITSPREAKKIQPTAAGMPGSQESHMGERAISHSPGRMMLKSSRWAVKAAMADGASMHTHLVGGQGMVGRGKRFTAEAEVRTGEGGRRCRR